MGDRELETYKFIRLIELTDIHEAENKQEIAVAMSKSMICVNEQDNRELRKMKHRSDQCRFKIKCLDRKTNKNEKGMSKNHFMVTNGGAAPCQVTGSNRKCR